MQQNSTQTGLPPPEANRFGMRRTALTLALILAMLGGQVHADTLPWQEVGRTKIPLTYYQGMTHDPAGNRYFSGPHLGLYRTDPTLQQIAANYAVIPPDVMALEGYDHIGDISYRSGLLLLPLECYYFAAGNTCGTGSIGIVDATTLQFLRYVKLDASEIPKAMWAEVSPDGTMLWTSVSSPAGGGDLLAYRMSEILDPANAAPNGQHLMPVTRLVGAVPPSRITGATFVGERLFLAGQDAGQQIWSVDVTNGSRVLEAQISFVGEAEGLDDDTDLSMGDALPGSLHWQVQPYNTSGMPTNGIANGALYHFERTSS